jgi:hypothetical protein
MDEEQDHPLRGPKKYYTQSKTDGNYTDFFGKQFDDYSADEESFQSDPSDNPESTSDQPIESHPHKLKPRFKLKDDV